MTHHTLRKLFGKDSAAQMPLYAIVDCATTSTLDADDEIYRRLNAPGAEKYPLMSGEDAWTNDRIAPFLVPLDAQPEIAGWLGDNWGQGWAVFFAAEGEIQPLLAHLKSYFAVRAENGREFFFRFYDPVILRDFLTMLDDEEKALFFGPVKKFLLEAPNGRPLLFERPAGGPAAGIDADPSKLVASKRHLFSTGWNARLMALHQAAYLAMGLTAKADAQSRKLIIEDSDGGRAVLQKTGSGVAVTTGEGRTFQYELSACQNPTAVTDPAGNRIEFDLQERENVVTQHKQPLLCAVRMEDNRRRWVFDYDEKDHVSRIDYPDGTHAQVEHDPYGRLSSCTDRNGATRRCERDPHERLTRLRDANGHDTVIEYEDRAAPARILFADGLTFAFAYSDKGSLQTFLAGSDKVADYHFDPDSGKWGVAYTDGTRAEFTVEDGRIVRAQNDTGTVELVYDDNGRLLSETFNGQTVTYRRNQSGLLTGIRTPDGAELSYTRDNEQRISAITDWSGRTLFVNYAANGALSEIDYPNGTTLQQATFAGGLPERMTLTSRDLEDPIFDRRIRRDLLDRVLHITDDQDGISYTYDPEGRLLSAAGRRPELCEHFTLDAKANIVADRNGSCQVNAADRIAQPGFAYDTVGNQISNTGPQGPSTYRWQSGNRMTGAQTGPTQARYTYDAFGRRVEKNINGVRTRYIWAGAQLLREIVIAPQGDKSTDYLFFPGTPVLLALRRDAQIYYAAFGHRYETLCLTDLAGRIAWQAEYDAFGNAHIATGHDLYQPMRLCGHYLDPETGLHYCSARYYDPHKGRYLSLDPLFAEGGGDNFYAYCNGDPINRIDPTGELIFVPILIGAALGAAIGAGIEAYRQHQEGLDTNWSKVAKAALIGGAVGAVGGGVGAAVQAGASAALGATAIGKSTLATLTTAGFLSGAGASVAEQCAGAIAGNAAAPLSIAGQALTDGLIGGGVALLTFGLGSVMAPRIRKAATAVKNAGKKTKTATATDKPIRTPVDPDQAKLAKARSNHRDKATAGEPVYAVTGEVILTETDFTLPGRIALPWTRRYGSNETFAGLLGPGWQTPADARLELQKQMVVFCDGSPGGAVFKSLPDTEPLMEAAHGAIIAPDNDGYAVTLKSGLTYHFSPKFTGRQTPVARISDNFGNHIAFVREKGVLHSIDISGHPAIRITCERGRITHMGCNGRTLAAYEYLDGRLAAAADPAGHKKRYAYQNGRLIRHSDRNHLSFYYEYDKKGRCTHSFGDSGLYDYRFEYPPYERRTQVTDSLGHIWHYHYDAAQQPVKVVAPDGGTTVYTYDEVGRITAVTDPLERTTCYDCDDAGNVIEITRPDDSRMVFAYDAQHHPVQILDPNDGAWEYAYDKHGRLIEKASPLGSKTTCSYTRSGDLAAVKDALGRTTAFDWDEAGRIQSITDPSGAQTHYQHDAFGNLTAVIDPAGRATRYSYDDKSRLVAAVTPSGLRQSFEWDPEDNLLLHTDAQGHQTRFEYTGLNELARRINPDGSSVQYHYDTEERLTAVTNEKGQTYRFAFDAAGRTIAQTDYYGHTHNYHYDPAGQLIQSIDPLSRTIAYSYDPAGRLTEKRFESDERETFTWDRGGNLIAFESPDIRIERTLDADNRLISEQSGAFAVDYEYDDTGLLNARTTSTGNRIEYCHDDNGRVSAIKINDQTPIRIARTTTGRITSESLSEKLSRTYGYDEEGRLIHQRIDSAATRIERGFAFDPSGHLIEKTDTRKGRTRFSYDPKGRIIESIDPMEQVKHYTYDPAGDLLEHLSTQQQGLRTAVFDKTTYRYDAAGNLVERQQENDTTRFAFDEQNRLRTVQTAPDETSRMAYDALGRRRYKNVNGERTFFAWDGDTLLAEWDEENRTREYVYYPGTFEPLALIDADRQVYYYHNDINGLPQEVTRPNGETVWSATYDALGRVEKILVDEVAQPLRLQGQYQDEETGLCYNRHRYYDPQSCSFISQDPIGLAGGENVYAYAPNVWGWVDPLGLCKGSRPESDSSGKSINIASDFINDKRKIGRSPLSPDFYSVPNSSGGRVYLSTKPISQNDFNTLVNTKNANGNIKVLTGTHGDLDGNLIPERAFFNEDFAKWGAKNSVDVIDITKLSDFQIDQLVRGEGRTICAWCYSERSTAVLKSLGFI